MNLFNFVQVYFIISVVYANCKDRKNRIESESGAEIDYDCHTEDMSSDCENNDNKVEIRKSVKPMPQYPIVIDTLNPLPLEYNRIDLKETSPLPPRLPPIGLETLRSYNESIYESDSIDEELNTTVVTSTPTAATAYMEEFTNGVSHTTTFGTANRTYQGNKSSEESDESKSTLIDYPFSVSVQRKGAHYTSGALLDKRWVVTSANEFYNVRDSLKLFRTRLGSVDCKRGGIIIPIKNIEFHPYFIAGKPNFDVAMIRLAFLVEFSDVIRPIAISTVRGQVLSAKFMTTYWPRLLMKGSVLPKSASERIKFNSMRVSIQRLIPQTKCIKMIKHLNEVLNESTLCLKPVVSHHSSCMPDAGAPIMAEDGLWGVTSGWTSPTCLKQNSPTVFTRLSSPPVRSWLNTVLLSL